MADCCFGWHSPNDYNVEHLVMCSLATYETFIPSLENCLLKIFAHLRIMLGFPCGCQVSGILYYPLFLQDLTVMLVLNSRSFLLSVLRDPFLGRMLLSRRGAAPPPWELCGLQHRSSFAHAHPPFCLLCWAEAAWGLHGERVHTKAVFLEFLISRPSASKSSERVVITMEGKVQAAGLPDWTKVSFCFSWAQFYF